MSWTSLYCDCSHQYWLRNVPVLKFLRDSYGPRKQQHSRLENEFDFPLMKENSMSRKEERKFWKSLCVWWISSGPSTKVRQNITSSEWHSSAHARFVPPIVPTHSCLSVPNWIQARRGKSINQTWLQIPVHTKTKIIRNGVSIYVINYQRTILKASYAIKLLRERYTQHKN